MFPKLYERWNNLEEWSYYDNNQPNAFIRETMYRKNHEIYYGPLKGWHTGEYDPETKERVGHGITVWTDGHIDEGFYIGNKK